MVENDEFEKLKCFVSVSSLFVFVPKSLGAGRQIVVNLGQNIGLVCNNIIILLCQQAKHG